MRVICPHRPLESWKVTRFPVLTTVPDQVDGFARLFAPPFGVNVALNVPSSLI